MRADMDKVIVERPRLGSRLPSRKKGYRKYCQQAGIENLPRREPLPGRWRGRQRFLNEHLGPMRRFLRSRVGRPWNRVHQELCEHVSFDNAVQKHVLTHVFDYVCRYVEERGPAIVRTDNWFRGRILRTGDMYVCPRTGILKVVKRRDGSRVPDRVDSGQLTQYHRREQTWWELQLRPRPETPGETLWDIWLERPVSRLTIETLLREYGGKLVVISKRPLSPREVRLLHRCLRERRRGSAARIR